MNLLGGKVNLSMIQKDYLNKRQTMLKIPEPLLNKKTNSVEDPGAFTYAKDKQS
jgi:hypothetical protein